MARLLMWNLSRLKTPSREMTGPIPEMYVRELTRIVEELQGVYLSGIQVGDSRRFAIPNPQFKTFPILYNPIIVDQYDRIKSEGEGCLSFPGLWVNISRYKYVVVRFRDGQWKEQTATFGSEDANTEEGLLSKAVQHEIAHMDGLVLLDRLTDPKKQLRFKEQILRHSIEQNRSHGVPILQEGPAEIDPCTLQQVNGSSSTSIGDGNPSLSGKEENYNGPSTDHGSIEINHESAEMVSEGSPADNVL